MDPWHHILNSLGPDYEKCFNAVMKGPQYQCTLVKKGRYTVLSLRECWEIDNAFHDTIDKHKEYDDYVNWTDEQLSTWKDVRRMAWDQWYFNRRQDAEKFITLFNLRWSQ